MRSREMLLTYFTKLSSRQIHKLPNSEKNQLLFMLQDHIVQTPYPHKKNDSHKKIVKYQRHFTYKSYIRRNISIIIRKFTSRLRREQKNATKDSTKQEGTTQFKSGIGQIGWRKMANFKKHFAQVVNEQNKQQLKCTICLEVFIQPVLTNCGHTFCLQCLDQSLLFSTNCPNCRESIKGSELIKCTILSNFIRNSAYVNTTRQGYPTYKQRLNQFEEWNVKRYVNGNTLKIGGVLDVRDTQNIWCQGAIINIQYNQVQKDTPISILVHFNRWNNIYNQMIEITSHRLAPYRFFTSRTDIPRYSLSLEDDNMRGLVVSGPIVEISLMSRPPFIEVGESSSEQLLPEVIPPIQPNNNYQTIFLVNNTVDQINDRVNQILQNWTNVLQMNNEELQIEASDQAQQSNQQEIEQQQQPNQQQQ